MPVEIETVRSLRLELLIPMPSGGSDADMMRAANRACRAAENSVSTTDSHYYNSVVVSFLGFEDVPHSVFPPADPKPKAVTA